MPNRPKTYVTAIGAVAAVQFDGSYSGANKIRRWVKGDVWNNRRVVLVSGQYVSDDDDEQFGYIYNSTDEAYAALKTYVHTW